MKPQSHSIGHEATAEQHRARSHRSRRRTALGKKLPPHSIGQKGTAAQHPARSHSRAATGKKPQPRSTGQEATAGQLHRARSHCCAVSYQLHSTLAPMTFTFIRCVSHPPLSLSFHFSFQLLDWSVGSDSLNISKRALWQACVNPFQKSIENVAYNSERPHRVGLV